jgi:hypothetical protein
MALWFTVQVKRVRVPIPLFLLLPLCVLLEVLALLVLVPVAALTRKRLLLRIGAGFYLTRLLLILLLYGGRFRVSVADGADRVRLHGGLWYR